MLSILWNAASNDAVTDGKITSFSGASLVGGPTPEYAAKMSKDELNQALSGIGSGLGIGVGYGSSGGRGVHSGEGWDSKGSVTCHSYGCQVNFARAPAHGMVAAFK